MDIFLLLVLSVMNFFFNVYYNTKHTKTHSFHNFLISKSIYLFVFLPNVFIFFIKFMFLKVIKRKRFLLSIFLFYLSIFFRIYSFFNPVDIILLFENINCKKNCYIYEHSSECVEILKSRTRISNSQFSQWVGIKLNIKSIILIFCNFRQ